MKKILFICLFVCGGLVGLVVLWIFNKGRQSGPPDDRDPS